MAKKKRQQMAPFAGKGLYWMPGSGHWKDSRKV
jgi:hypothetical protein